MGSNSDGSSTNVEKLVSDRQGAVESKTVDEVVVRPSRTGLKPRDGLRLNTFDRKSDAMNSIGADRSTKLDTGVYIVEPNNWGRSIKVHTVDRDRYRDFKQKHTVVSVYFRDRSGSIRRVIGCLIV